MYVNVKPAKYSHPLSQARGSQRSSENQHKRHNGHVPNGEKEKEPEAAKDTASQEQTRSYINLSQARQLSDGFIQEGKETTSAGGRGRHSPNGHKQDYKDEVNHTGSGASEVPPLPAENRSGSATPTAVSGDNQVTRERQSSAPPLPERRYNDGDVRNTPTPPLPDRHYDTPSPPPPIPERKYSNLEEDCDAMLVLEKTREQEMEAEMRRYKRKVTSSYEDVDLDDEGFKPHPKRHISLDNSSKCDTQKETRERAHEAELHRLRREESPYEVILDLEPHQVGYSTQDQAIESAPEGEAGHSRQPQRSSRNPDHMVSQMGNEYTLINPAWKRDVRDRPSSLIGDSDYLEAPPLPKRNPGMKYVDISHEAQPSIADSSSSADPYRDSIAYAVVKLDEISGNPLIEGRVLAPPEPYESPRASLPRNSVPPYATIDFKEENSGVCVCVPLSLVSFFWEIREQDWYILNVLEAVIESVESIL